MNSVAALRTVADVDPRADPERVVVSVVLWAVLDDGREVVLLDDRGWTSSGGWADVSVGEVELDSRTAVGPDEPFAGSSEGEMAAGHWATLCAVLRRSAGVVVEPGELARLDHEVVLGERLLARLTC